MRDSCMCESIQFFIMRRWHIESVAEGFFQLSTYTLLMIAANLLYSVGQFRQSCRCSLVVI